MRNLTSLLVFIAVLCLNAQTDDTPHAPYERDDSEIEEFFGYVVLTDGSRLEGDLTVSIKGYKREPHKFLMKAKGKKHKLEASQVTNYGMMVLPAFCDEFADFEFYGPAMKCINPNDLFQWDKKYTAYNQNGPIGKPIWTTRFLPGFVMLTDGEILQGEISRKEKDSDLKSVTLKNGKKKKTYKSEEIYRYGMFDIQVALEKQMFDGNVYNGFVDTDNGRIEGQVSFYYNKGVTTVFAKPAGGAITKLPAAQCSYLEFIGKNGRKSFYSKKGKKLQKQLVDGNKYFVYLNLEPTTLDEPAMREIAWEAYKKAEMEKAMASQPETKSAGKAILNALGSGIGSSLKLDAKKDEIIGTLDISGVKKIFLTEYVIVDKSNNSKSIVHKNNLSDVVAKMNQTCGGAIPNDDRFHQWDWIDWTVQIFDTCNQ